MKKFPFLLLDAGPIIKLFELGLWDKFIKECDVTVSQTVANEAKYAHNKDRDAPIDLEPYIKQKLIKPIDITIVAIREFYNKFDVIYKAGMHDGEKETLTFLCSSPENYMLCAADHAVFTTLGRLSRGHQGISLQEVLEKIGLRQSNLEWKYTQKFREKYTRMGEADSIQSKGLS